LVQDDLFSTAQEPPSEEAKDKGVTPDQIEKARILEQTRGVTVVWEKVPGLGDALFPVVVESLDEVSFFPKPKTDSPGKSIPEGAKRRADIEVCRNEYCPGVCYSCMEK
jgi:hypothetical protein